LLDYIRDLASKALIHVYEYEADDRKEQILKLLLKQLSEYMEIGNSAKDSSGQVHSKKDFFFILIYLNYMIILFYLQRYFINIQRTVFISH